MLLHHSPQHHCHRKASQCKPDAGANTNNGLSLLRHNPFSQCFQQNIKNMEHDASNNPIVDKDMRNKRDYGVIILI